MVTNAAKWGNKSSNDEKVPVHGPLALGSVSMLFRVLPRRLIELGPRASDQTVVPSAYFITHLLSVRRIRLYGR